MTKKEIIWREVLFQARQNKQVQFTQKEIAKKFGFSLSTVFNALKIPRQSHAVKVTGRFFILEDYKKLLYLWATHRNFQKEIIYQTFLPTKSIENQESLMPPLIHFGFYSAYKFLYNDKPADYDHFYIYADKKELKIILDRLLPKTEIKLQKSKIRRLSPNFFILQKDQWQKQYAPEILPEQIFVDIWNAPEWYAKDFLKALEEKLIQ